MYHLSMRDFFVVAGEHRHYTARTRLSCNCGPIATWSRVLQQHHEVNQAKWRNCNAGQKNAMRGKGDPKRNQNTNNRAPCCRYFARTVQLCRFTSFAFYSTLFIALWYQNVLMWGLSAAAVTLLHLKRHRPADPRQYRDPEDWPALITKYHMPILYKVCPLAARPVFCTLALFSSRLRIQPSLLHQSASVASLLSSGMWSPTTLAVRCLKTLSVSRALLYIRPTLAERLRYRAQQTYPDWTPGRAQRRP